MIKKIIILTIYFTLFAVVVTSCSFESSDLFENGILSAVSNMFSKTPSAPRDTVLSHLSLEDFLSETGLEFDDYITLMADYERKGIYLHSLEKNASRYLEFQEKHPELPFSTVIAYVNANVDVGFYENIQTAPNLDSLYILVNKNNQVSHDFVPSNLVDIGEETFMHREAARQFFKMKDTLRDMGYNINFSSAYRSYYRQEDGYNRTVDDAGQAAADQSVARPGHSEHQTGLAIDLMDYHAALPWLIDNAHKYGFILRYQPNGYEVFQGFKYEPWHWRYVGIDIATAMYNERICSFEEFYGKYLASDVLHNVKRQILTT